MHIKKTIKPHQPWIAHGYRGKPELTRQLVSHGFYFSIGEKFNAEALQEIPIDRLFCETDVSDTPLIQIYKNVADCLHIAVETLAVHIEENVIQTFNLPATRQKHPQAIQVE